MKKTISVLMPVRRRWVVLLLFAFAAFPAAAQNITVTGSVQGPDGDALPGVSVLLKGTGNGTVTDASGQFDISARPGDSLEFRGVGYRSSWAVASTTPLRIRMQAEEKGLDEIVVLGYGSQRKKEVTASVSSIDVSKLRDVPASNLTKLLQGQAAGVTVKQTTGSPGREFQVRVRGLGSLGAGSAPLYVIDGFAVGNSIGQNLNPQDIETITVLKDAVSTAIYGARGANGVVLITTKNAKAGETVLNVTANYGIQNIPDSRKTKVLNGVDFAQFEKDIFMDKIRYFEQREPDIDEVPLDFRYPEQTKHSTNWFDAILNQNAAYQDYNVSLSAGKGDIRSMISAGLVDQQGALINTNYRLYSVRANVEEKANDFIRIGLNMAGTYSTQNTSTTEGRSALVGSTLLMDPREPIYNEDGSYNSYIGGHDGIFGFPNPVQFLKENTRRRDIGDAITSAYVELSFLKHFRLKTTANVHYKDNSYKQFIPSTIAGVNAPPPRDASEYDESFHTLNLDADELLTYNLDAGDHHIEAMAGYTAQEETVKGLSGSGSQFPDDLAPYLNLAALNSSGSTEYGWSMAAVFGRLNYAYKGKYLFSGTFRREGSSRFGARKKWGNFPALSAGWRLSDEPFLQDAAWLTSLKLRGSWGITGNNDIGNYTNRSFMNPNNYILGGELASGKVIAAYGNSEVGWEQSSQVDVGLDLSAFDGRLNFTAEYYHKITSNMLLPIQLPAISGFTSYIGNIGKVRNNGLEFSAGYRTSLGPVNLWANANISFNRNKVLAMRGKNDAIWNGSMYADYNVSKVGRPIGMIYGFRVLGIFQNQDQIDKAPPQDGAIPGVYQFYDGNGNGQIDYNTDDMVEIGNPWPKATFGATLGGDYKHIDLSVVITGAEDYDVFRQIESSTMNMDGVFNVLEDSKLRWRSEAQPGSGKYATTNTWKWERESNSRYVYDASHVWIRNISIGYTLPKSMLKIAAVRVFISSDNLFLFTDYPGNNPDIDMKDGINPGLDDEAYPVPRTFSVGANLTF